MLFSKERLKEDAEIDTINCAKIAVCLFKICDSDNAHDAPSLS
jgi:hypothetical protein